MTYEFVKHIADLLRFGQYKKDRGTLQSGYGKYSIKLGSTQTAAEQAIGSFKGNTSEEYLAWLKKYQSYLTDTSRADEQLNKTINELETSIREAKNGIEEYDLIIKAPGISFKGIIYCKVGTILKQMLGGDKSARESN